MIAPDYLHDHWGAISALLDEGLALPASERRTWLDAKLGDDPVLRGAVGELLAMQAKVETDDFLGVLPRLADTRRSDTEPGVGDRVGPYRLIRPLGSGGMGTVWLAEREDGQPRRRVALKLPRLFWGGGLRERMLRERDILASLEHEHIARLYDAGVDDAGRPYLAMEYVQGQPIDAYCRTTSASLDTRLALMLQVMSAVGHAHARLVVHRDLKPANILVDENGRVRLLDFGIAKLIEGESTRETALTAVSGRALSVDYASPEQIRGAPLGTASDVYSLAVVLYEVLTGSRPYRLERGSTAELEEAIASVEPPLASDAARDVGLRRRLRGDLDAILNKALKKLATDRYATVQEFAADLQRYRDGRVVLAQPDRFAYRARKYLRRHRLSVTASATVLSAVLAGAGVSLWQASEARRQAARAETQAQALGIVGNFMLDTFSRVAGDATLNQAGARDAMASALRLELERTAGKYADHPQALGEVYGNAAAMFNYLQSPAESLAFALKELEHLRAAGAEPLKIAESERQIALAYSRSGDFETALQHLAAGRAVLPATADPATRTMRSRLWRATGMYLETTSRLGPARTALENAMRALEPDLERVDHYHGSAAIELARLLHTLGDDRRPFELLDRVRTTFSGLKALNDSEWGGLELAHGFVAMGLGHDAAAEAALRKAALHYGKQFSTSGPNAASIDAWLARTVSRQGRHEEARALADRALTILKGSPVHANGTWGKRALQSRIDLLLERGDFDAAAKTIAELKAQPKLLPAHVIRLAEVESEILSVKGRHDEARAVIAVGREVAERRHAESPRARRSLELAAAEVELAAGEFDAARRILGGLPRPATDDPDWKLLRAGDLDAAASLHTGRASDALAWYRSPASHLASDAPARRGVRDEARARLGFARALELDGRPVEAALQRRRADALLGVGDGTAALSTGRPPQAAGPPSAAQD